MNKSTENLFKTIEKGIMEVKESDKWKQYLTTMSKFHTYSFNNTILIYSQKPEASYIAGYYKWKNEFNRQVKRGEKGIRIFVPIRKKLEDLEEGDSIISGYKSATVFDVSQTFGEELPEYMNHSLQGKIDNYESFLKALHLISKVPIYIHPMDTEANGFYDSKTDTIEIRDDLSEIMTIKTCIHEIAHSILHKDNSDISKNRKETEAESVAFAVCAHYGIDTSDYSFPYLTGWSKNNDTEELKESIETIYTTTKQIINMLETVYS